MKTLVWGQNEAKAAICSSLSFYRGQTFEPENWNEFFDHLKNPTISLQPWHTVAGFQELVNFSNQKLQFTRTASFSWRDIASQLLWGDVIFANKAMIARALNQVTHILQNRMNSAFIKALVANGFHNHMQSVDAEVCPACNDSRS
jgi:hypothetical protein